jgi:hypothetical protein
MATTPKPPTDQRPSKERDVTTDPLQPPAGEGAAPREGEPPPESLPADVPIDPATGQPSYNPYTLKQWQATGLPQSGDPTQPVDLPPEAQPTETKQRPK